MPAWQPGQSGNPKGRKPGPSPHRKRFESMFWADLYNEWKEHGADVIAHVRNADPTTFLKIATSVLPRSDIEASVSHQHSIEVVLKPPAWLQHDSDTASQAIDITNEIDGASDTQSDLLKSDDSQDRG